MEITQELVERIAHLARLALSEDEKARMSAQLEEILGSMTALDRLHFEEEPLEQEGANVLRPDEVERPRISAGEHWCSCCSEQGGEER